MNIDNKSLISAQSRNVFLQSASPKLAGSESAGER